jgi:hypothetical protein
MLAICGPKRLNVMKTYTDSFLAVIQTAEISDLIHHLIPHERLNLLDITFETRC